MSFDFELKLDGKAMSKFMLRYNYTRMSGIVNLILGVAAAVVCVWRWSEWTANQRVAWIAIAVLLLVVQPLMLIHKARKQMSQESMKTPTMVHVDEEGITISQNESTHCGWNEVRKIKCYKDAIYVFTSAVRATVLTRVSCEEQFDELTAFVKGMKKA